MIKTTVPAKRAVAHIVLHYRQMLGTDARPAPLRHFATALSEALQPVGRAISHQSVKNWGDCRYLPDVFIMLQIANEAQHDWRGDFAIDILAAIHPDRYDPATEIGRLALLRTNEKQSPALTRPHQLHNPR